MYACMYSAIILLPCLFGLSILLKLELPFDTEELFYLIIYKN